MAADTSRIDNQITKARSELQFSGGCIDDNSLFVAAALIAHGLHIAGACGGHVGRKTGGVYIDLAVDGYSDYCAGHNLQDEKNDQVTATFYHRQQQLGLVLLKWLNDFYDGRQVRYEHMLRIDDRQQGVVRLSTNANTIVEELANEEKRKEWIIAVHDEFFAFGKYLFDDLSEKAATSRLGE